MPFKCFSSFMKYGFGKNRRSYTKLLSGGIPYLKPNEIRERIQKMFPLQKKIELFAREKVQDWDSWGNELKNSSNIFLDKPKQS